MMNLRQLIAPVLAAVLATGGANAALYQWSKTAATNATADATINWAEGMSPSSVNDSARAMMARIAEWRDDTSGVLTSGGTSTAYTLTTNQGLPSTPATGQLISFFPHTTNGANATLQVDGGTAFPIRAAGLLTVPAGLMVGGTAYDLSFTGVAWRLKNNYGAPNEVPLGAVLDYTGTSPPNASFVLANGQCISRTTYATYFALVGTTFGACDGSTTFGVPDLSNRVVAGLQMGGTARITVAGGNFNGNTLGATGGLENHAMTMSELVAHTHTGTTNSSTASGTTNSGGSVGATTTSTESLDHSHVVTTGTTTFNYTPGGTSSGTLLTSGSGNPFNTSGTNVQHTHQVNAISAHTHGFTTNAFTQTFTTASTGSTTPFSVMLPTMVLSKIVRVL